MGDARLGLRKRTTVHLVFLIKCVSLSKTQIYFLLTLYFVNITFKVQLRFLTGSFVN